MKHKIRNSMTRILSMLVAGALVFTIGATPVHADLVTLLGEDNNEATVYRWTRVRTIEELNALVTDASEKQQEMRLLLVPAVHVSNDAAPVFQQYYILDDDMPTSSRMSNRLRHR